MSTVISPTLSKRPWFRLAIRHLRMAKRLADTGFADGAAFHAYHAFECTLSSFIAAHGYAVPPDGLTHMVDAAGKMIRFYAGPTSRIHELSAHKARIILFNQLVDHTKPYFTTYSVLSRFLNVTMRNDALYYDSAHNLLPQQQYSWTFVSGLFPRLRQFIDQVWSDIR